MVAVNTSSYIIASQSSNGVLSDEQTDGPDISGDGRFIVFHTSATNLGFGENSEGQNDVYIRDTLLGTTKLVSMETDGGIGFNDSRFASVSDDGRYVAFVSDSRNLIPNDQSSNSQIYVRDMHAGVTFRISEAAGTPFVGSSANPKITSDGRYVVFESNASEIPDANGDNFDIFRYDLATGDIEIVSRNSAGDQGNTDSVLADISDDGRYVVFESSADNFVANDTNGAGDVFLRDTLTGVTTRVSVGAGDAQSNNVSFAASISANGRFVTFSTTAALVAGDTNGQNDVYMRDTELGTTTAISVSSTGAFNSSGTISSSDVSADGRYVVYSSAGSSLVAGDTNNVTDVFLRDTVANTTIRLSVGWNGAEANDASFDPWISDDGSYVTFRSFATNLTHGVPTGAGLHTYRVSLGATEGFDTLVGSDAADLISGLGGNDVIRSGFGNDTLNGGTGADQMYGGVGNDTYFVDNLADKVTELNQTGIDLVRSTVTFSLVGGFAENLTLEGSAAINGTGNDLANTIIGNGARNTLDGGLRADTLTGGVGQDNFRFTTTLAATNIDTITDFSHVADTIQIDNAVFFGLPAGALTAAQFFKSSTATAAADALDRIIYNTSTGALYFDRDGSNTLYNPIQFATLTGSPDDVDHTDFSVI